MPLFLALAALLSVDAGAPPCEVVLVNAADADLSLSTVGRDILLGPGERAAVPLASLASIDVGAIHHRYHVAPAQPVLCPSGHQVEVELRPDGQLRLRGMDEQPSGMPLEPVHVQDLTRVPPDASLSPLPSGTASG